MHNNYLVVFTWFAHAFFTQHKNVGIHGQIGSMLGGRKAMQLL